MVERKLFFSFLFLFLFFFFFLRLGVFDPATPEWAGPTWSPVLIPAGCECFVGEGGVWKEKVDKDPNREEDHRGAWGTQCGELPFCRAGLNYQRGGAHLPPGPTTASSLTGLHGEYVCMWGSVWPP